ncbi:MAG: UvrD-helicase domain-containing protein, partial [Gallionellaceae bacterium]|nr:UvrD-helicase domain-containing protein [Gallionellaceae bacterium]
MNNKIALNPQHSVVVEACAGSGKTWLLVSRILRLLLAGVKPGEILAITFTRKAAQEMQARLHEWLHLLATAEDAVVLAFLKERELHEVDDALLVRARSLYSAFLLAQPAITINTFHGWFMQILQRAPLNVGVPVGMQLLERTSALHEEAWQAFADSLRAAPDSETAQQMQWLFAQYGLHNTHALLKNFVQKRAEWWAYTAGEGDVVWALAQLRAELGVDEQADPLADMCADASMQAALYAFASALSTGTETQGKQAAKLQAAWEMADSQARFAALSAALYTQADEPRAFKPTKKQNAAEFILARDVLLGKMQTVREAMLERLILRMNQAALHCGVALLEQYQQLKLRQQQMDFTDVEWQVYRLLKQSDSAEYMQYKLDSRYRHVLLDEFQDTNPVQWQILQSWFAAATAAELPPTVFVVGDPKQSIYRFRRADARLFAEVSNWLQQQLGAHYLHQNVTRRNAPVVLQAVNNVFEKQAHGFVEFVTHTAHHTDLPGYVDVLPLSVVEKPVVPDTPEDGWTLRNPLIEPRLEKESGEREAEAQQFAAGIADIVTHWSVQDANGKPRRAEYRDIMVLVRKRIHLRVYENALHIRHIPFLTSRRGGLLDTLEAEDMQALLTFLITPFANLELAQILRSPLFSCSDEDLMLIAGQREDRGLRIEDREEGAGVTQSSILDPRSSWWSRLQHLIATGSASHELSRAHHLLSDWLQRADKLPVHDLLDRIYFESDLVRRYTAALPRERHPTVRANLQAFMEIALNVDAGRYPSLPRFLAELRDLRNASDNESPDEGRVGEVGNALRIYTVHEAKGLEAPIVWLLDTNDTSHKPDSYNVLLDWSPHAPRPTHFSLYSDKQGRGLKREGYFVADEKYAQSEQMNLLYVAMTRAKQALLVSGNGELDTASWYGYIAAAAGEPSNNPLRSVATSIIPAVLPTVEIDEALRQPLPTGQYILPPTTAQQQGIWWHILLQHLPHAQSLPPALAGIPPDEMASLLPQARHFLSL